MGRGASLGAANENQGERLPERFKPLVAAIRFAILPDELAAFFIATGAFTRRPLSKEDPTCPQLGTTSISGFRTTSLSRFGLRGLFKCRADRRKMTRGTLLLLHGYVVSVLQLLHHFFSVFQRALRIFKVLMVNTNNACISS